MKRILFIHHGKFPGGAEKSLYDVIMGFSQKDGLVCHFLGPKGYLSSRLTKICPVKITPIIRFKRTFCPFTLTRYSISWLKSSYGVWKYCRLNKINYIYANSASAVLYSLMATSNSRIVLHLRDRLKHSLIKILIKRFCYKVISVSDFIDSQLNFLKASQHCVIHNGIDPDLLKKTEPRPLKTIGYVGQIIPWKRIDILIQAMQEVAKHYPDTKLLITGNDWYNDHPKYHERLREITKELDLEKNVAHKEWHEDVNSIFSKIDLLVLPSESEPFGRILIEAMSAGIPVIGINSGAVPEIINHEKTGLLCENSPDDIAKEILRLFKDKHLMDSIRTNAMQKVKKDFNIKDTINNIYKELVETSCE